MPRYSVLREDVEYKEASQLYYGKSVIDWNKDFLLGELVKDYEDDCELS